ncbi:hypothetical protein IFM89_011403 [Coptis chinensis]|uniref:Uncharacterized protein n=1 Tax=Coptis chinensis TaxID=261450 RepID=A0A835LV82_9MAGN|nr:hypothetical protein IFM89_011403 [Coptis chinensis]
MYLMYNIIANSISYFCRALGNQMVNNVVFMQCASCET